MEITASDGMPFWFLMKCLFSVYPQIEHTYPPGKLGFFLNNKPPALMDSLHEGDVVIFKDCL